jgi:hypothetical protein
MYMFRLFLISICLICSAVSADTPVVYEDFKLLASDGATGDWFGYSVATSGNTVVVGAPYDDDNGSDSGSVYIYRFNGTGWVETKLLASDGKNADLFGHSVSVSGDTVVVGAIFGEDNYAGSVYVYSFNGTNWIETKLDSGDLKYAQYGYSVSISGDTIVVGEPYSFAGYGRAHIYRFNDNAWSLTQSIGGSGNGVGAHFGFSVSVDGDTIVVGVPDKDYPSLRGLDDYQSVGAAHVYQFNGWFWYESDIFVRVIVCVPGSGIRYGHSVAVSGDTIVVGSVGCTYPFVGIKRFDGSEWVNHGNLDYSAGTRIAISGDTIVKGNKAYGFDFVDNQWVPLITFSASDGAIGDGGGTPAISGGNIVLGIAGDDDNGTNSGSAYIFDLDVGDPDNDGVPNYVDNCYLYNPDQADCNGNEVGDVCDIADGTSNDIDGNGIPDECEVPQTFIVDDDGKADFDNIQAAVDVANNGDEIVVMPGTYTSTADEVVNMLGKEVWLHSSEGQEVTIIDSQGTRGGIVCDTGETAKTIIEGFAITNGHSTYGGGMYNKDSNPTLVSCTFIGNFANSDGGGMYNKNSNPTLENCLFTGNNANNYGAGMWNSSSSPTLTDCTFEDNYTTHYGGGGMWNSSSSPTLTNCIFTGNHASSGGGMWNSSNSNPTLTDTVVCGNTPDQIYGDYTNGGGNTIADECETLWTGACCIDTNCSIETAADCSALGGSYSGDGSSCWGDPCGGGTYTTWTVDDDGKADFDNIQEAVNAADDGDEIVVMPGTYTGSGEEVVNMLGKAVWLHSSDGEEETFINGAGLRRGIYCGSGETSGTIIEGFTITNGDHESKGGGMYNYDSSPTLTNCRFTNNDIIFFGAGMYNENSSPSLTNCIFTYNDCIEGGGMYNENSSPILTDCSFEHNTAINGNGNGTGGGITNAESSNPILIGCIIKNNTTGYIPGGGGMYNYSDSSAMLTNTVVCGNLHDQISGDWTDNGGNVVADECPECPDINGDGYVNVSDLLTVIDQWGLTNSPADVNEDGIVDVSDLLIVVGSWGPCE